MNGAIVVGTDGSETAAKAVARAAELAGGLGCAMHVVSAYEPVTEAELKRERAAARDERVAFHRQEEVDEVLERTAEQLNGAVDVHYHARVGDPARAILDVARDAGAQLIVVGNRGMAGARRFLLGSVPNTVSHHAHCDVMIVRTTE